MTIGQTWTDPNTLEKAVGDDLPATEFNATLANINAASGVVFLGAADLIASTGTPTTSSSGPWQFYVLDPASDDEVEGVTLVPAGWVTVNIIFWWANAGAGSGNVRFDVTYDMEGDGGSIGGGTTASSTVAAQAASVIEKTTMASSVAVTAGSLLAVGANRDADNGADTLAENVYFLGIEIRRAS